MTDPAALRICSIDDDAVDRTALKRAIRGADIMAEFAEAESVEEALALLIGEASSEFDIVFLDYNLPGGDGLEVLRSARKGGVRAPIIVLTGLADDEAAVEMMKAGATDYIVKDRLNSDILKRRIPPILRAHRVEAELRSVQERLGLAINAASIGTWEMDTATRLILLDATSREIFAIPHQDPVDLQNLLNMVDPAFRKEIEDSFSGALSGHGAAEFDHEVQYFRPDGLSRWVRTFGKSYNSGANDAGRPIRLVGVHLDTTDGKEAEAALREETRTVEKLNLIGKSLTAETDRDRILQLVTDEATRLIGAEFGAFFYNVLGEDGEAYLLYTLSGADRESFDHFGLPRNTPLFNLTFNGAGTVRHDDVTQADAYGSLPPHHGMPAGHLPVHSYLAVPVISADREVIGGLFFGHQERGVFTERHESLIEGIAGWAAIALDNARLVEAERKSRVVAEDAVTLRDEVLAIVSHDLRNPLNTISGVISLITDVELDESQRDVHFAILDRATKRMDRLIQDLLDVAKIEAGHLTINPGPIELQPLLAEVCQMFDIRAAEKGLTLSCKPQVALPLVEADRDRLLQVLGNLVSNALHYTDAGSVTIDAHSAADSVVVSVQDTGSGILPEHIDQLFGRFWQARKGDSGGAGLGLAIAKGIMESHGGKIWVESEVDAGSTFFLSIPAARATSEDAGAG